MLIFYRIIYIIATLVSPFVLPSVVRVKDIGAEVVSTSLLIVLLLINLLFMLLTFVFFYASEKQHGNSDEDTFLISFICMTLIDYAICYLF